MFLFFKKWPFIGSLSEKFTNGSYRHLCGVSLISETTLLTSAHCIFQYDFESYNLVVILGTSDLTILDNPNTLILQVYDIDIHPSYEQNSYNDIGIIYVENKIVFSNHISPICIPNTPFTDVDAYKDLAVYVGGFGSKSAYERKSTNLIVDLIQIFPKSYCDKSHDIKGGLLGTKREKAIPHLFQDSLICAGRAYG